MKIQALRNGIILGALLVQATMAVPLATDGLDVPSTTSTSTICEQFVTFSTGEMTLEDITGYYKMTEDGLYLLNSHLVDMLSLVDGSPVCVVGSVGEKNIGKRPAHLVQYETKPGVTTCLSILKEAMPPISAQVFEELNAHLSCSQLNTDPVNVYLPKGTTFIFASEKKKSLRAVENQDCTVGSWGDWTPCQPDGNAGETSKHFHFRQR